MSVEKYVHIEPGQENNAIGGHYEVEKEMRLAVDGREVLCILGYACWDNTCCSAGGCRYAFVPGYILEYKKGMDDKGRYVSRVERVTDEEIRRRIKVLIKENGENVQLVDFW